MTTDEISPKRFTCLGFAEQRIELNFTGGSASLDGGQLQLNFMGGRSLTLGASGASGGEANPMAFDPAARRRVLENSCRLCALAGHRR